jgi:hypothetical protein
MIDHSSKIVNSLGELYGEDNLLKTTNRAKTELIPEGTSPAFGAMQCVFALTIG